MTEVLDLSIIIINFNTKELLRNCLNSIFKETKKIKYEIIVVDNASSDGSVGLIGKYFPKVRIIKNDINIGFAKANNQGVKIAKGSYILFLNSDTLVLDQAIEKSWEFLQQRKDIDVLGCQLLNSDESIQPSGGFFPKLPQVFFMMFFIDDLPFVQKLFRPYQVNKLDFYKRSEELDWVTGAFLLIKKNVLDELNGFDENYFMYSEEVDLCFRAKKLNHKVWYYSKAKILHLKGKSSADGFSRAVLGEYGGLQKFYQKHYSRRQLFLLRIFLKTGALLRVLLFGILKKDKAKRETYEKAFKMV